MEILAFPCNQFREQEPGTNAEIKEYARKCMNAKFPLFSKINCNGNKACEVFKFLRRQSRLYSAEKGLTRQVPWNFTKFLVANNGTSVVYFNPRTTPREIAPQIQAFLLNDTPIVGSATSQNGSMYSTLSLPKFDEESKEER